MSSRLYAVCGGSWQHLLPRFIEDKTIRYCLTPTQGLCTFPAEMKRDMNLAAWRGLTKRRTAAAVLQVLAACIVAFAHVLQREAQQSPHSNLARASNPYFLMHEIVSSAAEATYSMAGYAEPAPLERPAARAFLAAIVKLLQAAAQPEVHPEQQVSSLSAGHRLSKRVRSPACLTQTSAVVGSVQAAAVNNNKRFTPPAGRCDRAHVQARDVQSGGLRALRATCK